MDRADALHWWRALPKEQKEELARKHFPHMPFIAVDKSSSWINRIADKESN